MIQLPISKIIVLDKYGWILGSNIESKSNWMKWIHPFPVATEEQFAAIMTKMEEQRNAYWKAKNITNTSL